MGENQSQLWGLSKGLNQALCLSDFPSCVSSCFKPTPTLSVLDPWGAGLDQSLCFGLLWVLPDLNYPFLSLTLSSRLQLSWLTKHSQRGVSNRASDVWKLFTHLDREPMQFLTFYYILACSWLTMLWSTQVHSRGTQPQASMHPFSPPLRLPHNIEQSTMCCAIGPCWLSILSIAVCTYPSQTP